MQNSQTSAGRLPQGFGSADGLETVGDFDGDTYRTVYTLRFEGR
jgi:hypothetical protein